MARSKPNPSGGGEGKTPLIIALVFFVLATIVAGVLAFTYQGDLDAVKKESDTAKEESKTARAELSKEQGRARLYQVILGIGTEDDRPKLAAAAEKDALREEHAKIMGLLNAKLQTAIEAEKTVYSASEPVRARWSGVEEPARFDWLGVYPAGDQKAPRLAYKLTGGMAEGTTEIPANFVPGKYDLRLFRDSDWDLLGVSAPFEVAAVVGSLRVVRGRAAAGATLPVHWSAINFPTRKDWIGVFPRGLNAVVLSTQTLTGGTAEGQAGIRIPKGTPPGEYEVRLYSAGGWTLLSTQPLTLIATGE